MDKFTVNDKIFDYLNAIIMIAESSKESEASKAIKVIAIDASNYLRKTYVKENKNDRQEFRC